MAQVKLKVLQDYRSWDIVYKAGEEIEVPETMATWLMNDAPVAFERIQEQPPTPPQPLAGEGEEKKAVEQPPKDKMVRRAPRKK